MPGVRDVKADAFVTAYSAHLKRAGQFVLTTRALGPAASQLANALETGTLRASGANWAKTGRRGNGDHGGWLLETAGIIKGAAH